MNSKSFALHPITPKPVSAVAFFAPALGAVDLKNEAEEMFSWLTEEKKKTPAKFLSLACVYE